MIKKIRSLNDVQKFAEELVREQVVFHPDDDFAAYAHKGTGQLTYTADEAAMRNALMGESFDVCKRKNQCIYEVMGDAANQERKRLGYFHVEAGHSNIA